MSAGAEPKTCFKCGQPLGGLAPAGVCPRCLLLTGLDELDNEALEQSGPRDVRRFGPDLPRRFGDYELLEEIARGGMGIVYKARQVSLDRIVAVKMLLFGQYTSEEFIHRFRIEASAAASLQHPNIVAIHEVGVHQGQHYFAMDFVDGPNLSQFCRDQPLPAKRAASYLKAIAEAIQFAHQRRILHRDLKPANILIDSSDQPRITDFGLAKRMASTSDSRLPTPDLTLTGQTLGSPSYIPPEQASVHRGKIGPHSDVYSMGAILYHALTGRPPFVGETLADTLQQVLQSEPIAPRRFRPTVPTDLETICIKCLEKETSKRYATAEELAAELSRFLRDEPIHARPVTAAERVWRWGRRNPALAGSLAVVLLLLLVLGIGSPLVAYRINQARKSEAAQRSRAEAETLKARENLYAADIGTAHREIEEGNLGRAQKLLEQHIPLSGQTDLRGFEWRYLFGQLRGEALATMVTNVSPSRYLCASPDGQLLGSGRRVWNVTTRAVVLDLGNGCTALGFAPRDQALLYERGGTNEALMRRDVTTGNETILLEQEKVAAITFSRSGRWLATGSDRGLRLWDATTWQLVTSATNAPFDFWPSRWSGGAAFSWFSAKGLAFSPDEKLLIAASGYALSHLSELSAWRIPTLERVPMPANSVDDPACVVFAPDGREFLTGGWDGDVRIWDAATLAEIPSRRSVNAHRSWIAGMDYLPGTRKLITAGADRCLRIWDTETHAAPITLRGHTEEIEAMTLASDGKIYTAAGDNTIKQWLPERPASSDEALSHFASPQLPAGLCSDGKLLATVSQRAVHFWRIREPQVTEDISLRVELAGLGELPLNWRKNEGMAAVSPNRKWLAVGRRWKPIEVLDLTLPQSRRALPSGSAPYQFVAFSPDSRLLVTCRATNSAAVFDTSTWREITLIQTPGKKDTDFPFHFAERAPVLAVEGLNSVVLWNTTTCRTINEILSDRGMELIGCAISADARMVAMGYMNDTFSLHDCNSGRQIASIPSHVSGVEWLAFSPDGKTLATASGRWVRLWNLATHREMFPIELPCMAIHVAFVPDGTGLLTAEMGGTTRLWRAPAMEEISVPQRAKADQ